MDFWFLVLRNAIDIEHRFAVEDHNRVEVFQIGLWMLLQLLIGSILAINGAGTVCGVFFLDTSHASLLVVFISSTVEFFFEDRIGLNGFELGLEVAENLCG